MIGHPVSLRKILYCTCGILLTILFFTPLLTSHGQPSLLFQNNPFSWSGRPNSSTARWLIATMSDAGNSSRRDLIRETWQTLYADPAFHTRFILSQHDDSLSAAIARENDTHGDLLRLDTVATGAKAANTVKAMELFKYLVSVSGGTSSGDGSSSNGSGGGDGEGGDGGVRKNATPPYDFVTKLDDDVFLVATKFLRDYILPRTSPHPVSRTLIGRLMQQTQQFIWPQGSFYTLSWDLVALLAELHTKTPITDEPEDVLVGKLLFEAGEAYDFVKLDGRQAFDIPGPDARPAGVVSGMAIAPHKLKDEATFREVAGIFG